jgi:hypothetical protein
MLILLRAQSKGITFFVDQAEELCLHSFFVSHLYQHLHVMV